MKPEQGFLVMIAMIVMNIVMLPMAPNKFCYYGFIFFIILEAIVAVLWLSKMINNK